RISPASQIAPVVTAGPSNYDPAMPDGLKINLNEPLVCWYKAYRRTVGRAPQAKDSSYSKLNSTKARAYNTKDDTLVEWQDSSVRVGAATFKFNRTLRVPDDATTYALPPGLGTFPLVKAESFSSTLPEYIERRGGYIMPLFQREALWISISDGNRPSFCTRACAIKISVGGINALTGYGQDDEPPEGVQDYVVGGQQPWLDGIATEPGVVRQFVAMRLGGGYTIEEQLSAPENGGIQIDVFPSLTDHVAFYHDWFPLELESSPNGLNILEGETITLSTRQWPPPETLQDLVHLATPRPVLNVSYGNFSSGGAVMQCNSHSIRYGIQHLPPGTGSFLGMPDARMGIAAGGKIIQKIYKDSNSPIVYDDEDPSRIFIHTATTAAWEIITGTVCPLTPITPTLYKAHDYPWYALYDEQLPTVQPTGRFDHLQSIHERDYILSNEPVDPESPPDCARHAGRTSTCIARPCSHPACVECFGAAIFSGWKCPECSRKIDQHIGFNKPVPKVANNGDGDNGSWWKDENQIQGVRAGDETVKTLMLQEDRISPLHGCNG
ncbi:hypothetical protein DL96DRAFT_1477043, partial [Flagelloscypha sp. PMI_526]